MDVKVKVNTRITFQGREYDSPDALPTEARQAYERAMTASDVGQTRIAVGGQSYASLDDVPAQYRALVQDALGAARSRVPPAQADPGQVVSLDPLGAQAPRRTGAARTIFGWLVMILALIFLWLIFRARGH